MKNVTSFLFTPYRLPAVAQKIEMKHPKGKDKFDLMGDQVLLSKLKERLRKITSENLLSVAFCFTTHELYVLCSNITDLLKEDGLSNRVMQVLSLRIRKGFLKYFWDALQDSPTNVQLKKILYEMISKNRNLGESLRIDYVDTSRLVDILGSDNIVASMASYVRSSSVSVVEYLDRYHIRTESVLSDQVFIMVLSTGNLGDYSNNSVSFWRQRCTKWSIEEKAKVLNQYWTIHDLNRFDAVVMEMCERQYGMPDYERQRFFWSNINEVAKRKYKQWHFLRKLEVFFTDSERLHYWKKWVFAMEDMYYIRKREQLFMDFGRIVVIEFGQTGNAAYFYESGYFYRYLFEHTKPGRDVTNQTLRGYDNLGKIDHRGAYWGYYMDNKLASYGVGK